VDSQRTPAAPDPDLDLEERFVLVFQRPPTAAELRLFRASRSGLVLRLPGRGQAGRDARAAPRGRVG
jgi:hypothetical protein